MEGSPLDGVRIVEVAGPLTEHAGRTLAELGAAVYLVEPPQGSPTRQRRPFAATADSSRRSVPFLARNVNKRSVVLDDARESDRAAFQRLAHAADAVLTDANSPWSALARAASDAVVVTIEDQHQLASSGLVPFAASGGLSSSGWGHQPPCNAPSWLALDAAGIYSAGLALIGIRLCRQGMPAARFTVPLEEAALAGLTPWTRPLMSYGLSAAGQGVRHGRLGGAIYPIFPCRDGYVRLLTSTPRQWQALLTLFEHPAVLEEPEWQQPQHRAANTDMLFEVGAAFTREHGRDELFHAGQKLGLTITPVLSPAEVLQDPHVRSRALFVTVDDPDLGAVCLPRAPYRFSESGPPDLPIPAPGLDAHGAEARSLDVRARPSRVRGAAGGASAARPFAGIRVLELGVGAVVPELASLLALLGAEVIKIESRVHLDFLRQGRLPGHSDDNSSVTFNQLNLGVLSCAVDMRDAEGRALVQRLAATCDLVLENMRGPVVQSWGLDYEAVRAQKPDIIYLSSQGLGEGVYGGYQTFGPNLQAFSGVTALWAHPSDPYPIGTNLNHPDHLAGKQAMLPIVAALMQRDETGEGAYIDAAQFEMASSLIADKFLAEQIAPGSVQPLGNRSLDAAPHGVYPCLGDDAWCALAVTSDAEWLRLRGLIGQAWASDPAWETVEGRLSRVDELDLLLAEWTRAFAPAELEGLLRTHGIAASRVVIGADLVARTEDHHTGLFSAVPHPTAGTHWYTGLPFTDGDGRHPTLRRPPLLGEHTEYVLGDLLGLDGPSLSRLADAGVIGH
jgi:crotonobetainyl-CoA:carnitine CoA-transferase CaiB-like acyl-CoA transferase